MVNYRRYLQPGGIYFFTLNLHNRKSDWLVRYVATLKNAMKQAHQFYPYRTIALVILPDHLHAIWELPENDTNFSIRWQYIKNQFTRALKNQGLHIPTNKKGENILWQKRFWEHAIRDEADYNNHVNYIHYNPVKHGLATETKDWPYSTFHKYVKNGLLPKDWCFQGEDINRE